MAPFADIAQQVASRTADHGWAMTAYAPLPGGVVVIADVAGHSAEARFGFADLQWRTPTRSDHRFEAGSISKSFTALVMSQLIDEGRISLETPITDVLPWVRLGGDGPVPTIRTLANHTAGLILGADALPDAAGQVAMLSSFPACSAAAANHFHYSNIGYLMLGLAIEKLTGHTLAEEVARRILEPAAMTQSSAAITHDIRSTLATGYTPWREDRPWVPGDMLAPATWFEVAGGDGMVVSTGGDLARFGRLIAGHGTLDGIEVLAASTVDRAITTLGPGGEDIVSVPGLAPTDSSRYGLGLNVERSAGHDLVTHGGGMVGYSTFLIVDMSAGIVVVVLTNANGDNLYAQMLARLAHADVVGSLEDAPITWPNPDPTVRGTNLLHSGLYVAASGARVSVAATPERPVMLVGDDGVRGHLWRRPTGGYVTDLPQLRTFSLVPIGDRPAAAFAHGSEVYHHADHPVLPTPVQAPSSAEAALVGHYHCYCPWYPDFRIVWREGSLHLIAASGVEAPSGDTDLVPLGDGQYRIGADEHQPERLRVLATVDQQTVLVDRDGCLYSRASDA